MINYDPKKVRTGEAIIISITGSGVAFAAFPHHPDEDPETVVIAPRYMTRFDVRIGDTVEIGFVGNYPDHIERCPYRAVAVYKKIDFLGEQEVASRGRPITTERQGLDARVRETILQGEVWNRSYMYGEMFGTVYESLTATNNEKARYEAVGGIMLTMHNDGECSMAKIYGPSKKNATAVYYAKDTQTLIRSIMGMDPDEGSTDGEME